MISKEEFFGDDDGDDENGDEETKGESEEDNLKMSAAELFC